MAMSKNTTYQKALGEIKGPSPDMKRVVELLEKSIADGDPEAEYALGTWYLHGHGEHVRKNTRKALSLIRSAAKKGHPTALYDLAVSYEIGNGVKKNEERAFECYLKSALRTHEQSIYEVGRCYYYGIGTEKNAKLSRIWLIRAKELGVD